MNIGLPSSAEIGEFIDSKAGNLRTPKACAGRLLEEVVELCLKNGMTAGEIYGHVDDSIFNQCLKEGLRLDKTVFPSQINQAGRFDERREEAADVYHFLADYCHVDGIDLPKAARDKQNEFIKKSFRVSANGTLYAIKGHVK
ncbi:MAG: hypothetical protein E6R08_10215 [Nevskiaceae bacterium]|nr:MAG: hypothetical protein E6R08_10215 [Nevskiaceae bacterium]